MYRVRGRVQGVGFRYFVEHSAQTLGIRGWVRNVDDGSVEVYAVGAAAQLSDLAGLLWQGPRWAEVRGVEEMEAPVEAYAGFSVRQ
jgi:acylphosphatase